MPPPPVCATFPLIVQLVSVREPLLSLMAPPPPLEAELPENVTPVNDTVAPSFSIAPPLGALLPMNDPPFIVSDAEELPMAPSELEACCG